MFTAFPNHLSDPSSSETYALTVCLFSHRLLLVVQPIVAWGTRCFKRNMYYFVPLHGILAPAENAESLSVHMVDSLTVLARSIEDMFRNSVLRTIFRFANRCQQ